MSAADDHDGIPEDEKRAFDKRISDFTGGRVHIEDILKGSEKDSKFISKLVSDVVTGIAIYIDNENKAHYALTGIDRSHNLMGAVNAYIRIFLFELMRMWNGVNMKMDQNKARRDLGLGPREDEDD